MLTLYIADVERDVGMKKLSQEEAVKVLESMKVKIKIPKAAVTQWKRNAALDMAIEALKYSEVPNSSDCISRQEVLDEAFEVDTKEYGRIDVVGVDAIDSLPPVTPQQRIGKWIPLEYDGYADGNPVWDKWECSECGWEHDGDEESLTAFCPNCGQPKMQEIKE